MERDELIKAIKEAAYLEGDFVLRSGRRSKYYLDKYLFETEPAILAELGRLLAARCSKRTSCIAGAELGGVPLASATALVSGKHFVIVRNAKKDYGTAKPLEGRLDRAEVVLLVEDIATTGGQVLEAARALSQAGAEVEKIVAVIDRQEGAGENIAAAGWQFESLFTKTDLGITS
jgi:orotate phosphoribosyltransferase